MVAKVDAVKALTTKELVKLADYPIGRGRPSKALRAELEGFVLSDIAEGRLKVKRDGSIVLVESSG